MKKNLQKEVEGIIPEMVFNGVLITANKLETNSSIIIPSTAKSITYSEIQEVVKVGPGATYGGNPQVPIKVGDIVNINVLHFLKHKTKNSLQEDLDGVKDVTTGYRAVELPIIVFHNKEYMFITDRDILYYWKGIKNEAV